MKVYDEFKKYGNKFKKTVMAAVVIGTVAFSNYTNANEINDANEKNAQILQSANAQATVVQHVDVKEDVQALSKDFNDLKKMLTNFADYTEKVNEDFTRISAANHLDYTSTKEAHGLIGHFNKRDFGPMNKGSQVGKKDMYEQFCDWKDNLIEFNKVFEQKAEMLSKLCPNEWKDFSREAASIVSGMRSHMALGDTVVKLFPASQKLTENIVITPQSSLASFRDFESTHGKKYNHMQASIMQAAEKAASQNRGFTLDEGYKHFTSQLPNYKDYLSDQQSTLKGDYRKAVGELVRDGELRLSADKKVIFPKEFVQNLTQTSSNTMQQTKDMGKKM